MTFNALKMQLAPPDSPADLPGSPGDWDAIEATLGTELPADYKYFISLYGTGCIDEFLYVYNPFAKNRNLNLLNMSKRRLDMLRTIHFEQTPLNYPLFPARGGLFPWAGSDNGDGFYWLCEKSPDEWKTVVHEGRVWTWQQFDLSATDLLAKVLSREVRVKCFPNDFPSSTPGFVPLSQ